MLILSCSDPSFSYQLKKNPSQGIVIQSVKKGYVLGWYYDQHTFCINFVDPPNQSSFGSKNENSGDYINTQQYCTAELLYFAITNTLGHLLKTSKTTGESDLDENETKNISMDTSPVDCANTTSPPPSANTTTNTNANAHTCSLRWNPVSLGTKMKFMCNQLENMGFDVTITPHSHGLSDLVIANSSLSLSDFVKVLYLLSQWLLTDHDATGSVSTIAKIIKNTNCFIPYFIRKSLLMKATRNQEAFSKWKAAFELTSDHQKPSGQGQLSYHHIKLTYGFNSEIRKQFVLQNIPLRATNQNQSASSKLANDTTKCVVVDIGCGNKPVVCLDKKRHPNLIYIGVDKQEDILEGLRKRCGATPHTHFLTSIPDALALGRKLCGKQEETELDESKAEPGLFYVTATEMLEHVTDQEARHVLHTIFEHQPDVILLTTPNKDFNKYYHLEEDEVRDDDHVNEMGWDGFQSFVLSALQQYQSTHPQVTGQTCFHQLGDECDQIHNISGCKIMLSVQKNG